MQSAVSDVDKLARTDRDIAEVERRVARQLAFIEALVSKDLDTRSAETLLRLMRHDLDAMRRYRHVLLDEPGLVPSSARPAGTPTRRPERATTRPCPAGRGPAGAVPAAPRPGLGAAGPVLAWESLPNRTLIARAEDHVFVVRPYNARGGTFRFAVLRALPADGGLLHVAHGGKRTAREAMLAAERALPRTRTHPHPHP